eukprot:5074814-Pyramimonas_sp.AAC.1
MYAQSREHTARHGEDAKQCRPGTPDRHCRGRVACVDPKPKSARPQGRRGEPCTVLRGAMLGHDLVRCLEGCTGRSFAPGTLAREQEPSKQGSAQE